MRYLIQRLHLVQKGQFLVAELFFTIPFLGASLDLSMPIYFRALIAKIVSVIDDPIVNPNMFKLRHIYHQVSRLESEDCKTYCLLLLAIVEQPSSVPQHQQDFSKLSSSSTFVRCVHLLLQRCRQQI
jgi:hypothetical protein